MNKSDEFLIDSDSSDFAYEKLHKRGHHRIFIAIDGILAVGLIVALTTFFPQVVGHRTMTMLEHSGGVLLNAANLENHISLPIHAGNQRYWLGPISGMKYTTNCVTPGVLTVDYFLLGQSPTNGSRPNISVSAYASHAVRENELIPLSGVINATFRNSLGETVSYNAFDLWSFTVTKFPSKNVIEVEYSSPQSLATLMADSQNLQVVKSRNLLF